MSSSDVTPEPTCNDCHGVHPSKPFTSELAICLHDPEFEPYIDDIIDHQDFSRCQELVRRKRFQWDRPACERFDPVEDSAEGEELSPELAARLTELAKDGKLTEESVRQALLEDVIDHIDWAHRSVDANLHALEKAESPRAQRKAVQSFGFLIGQGNRPVFEGLCRHLRELAPPENVPDKELRIEILRQLGFTHDRSWQAEVAQLLVDDLFRMPSNQTTRGWYTAVFNYFERSCPKDIAGDALERMLDTSHFSYRIKRRVRDILDRDPDDGFFW